MISEASGWNDDTLAAYRTDRWIRTLEFSAWSNSSWPSPASTLLRDVRETHVHWEAALTSWRKRSRANWIMRQSDASRGKPRLVVAGIVGVRCGEGRKRQRGTVERRGKKAKKKRGRKRKEKKRDADNGQDRCVYSGLMAGENRRGKPHLDFTGDRRIHTTLACQNVNRSVKPSGLLGLLPESSKQHERCRDRCSFVSEIASPKCAWITRET